MGRQAAQPCHRHLLTAASLNGCLFAPGALASFQNCKRMHLSESAVTAHLSRHLWPSASSSSPPLLLLLLLLPLLLERLRRRAPRFGLPLPQLRWLRCEELLCPPGERGRAAFTLPASLHKTTSPGQKCDCKTKSGKRVLLCTPLGWCAIHEMCHTSVCTSLGWCAIHENIFDLSCSCTETFRKG